MAVPTAVNEFIAESVEFFSKCGNVSFGFFSNLVAKTSLKSRICIVIPL